MNVSTVEVRRNFKMETEGSFETSIPTPHPRRPCSHLTSVPRSYLSNDELVHFLHFSLKFLQNSLHHEWFYVNLPTVLDEEGQSYSQPQRTAESVRIYVCVISTSFDTREWKPRDLVFITL